MDVLHISTKDINGGAARAANRLHHGLTRLNINSRMFVAQKQSLDQAVFEFKHAPPMPLHFGQKLKRYVKRHTDSLNSMIGRTPNIFSPLHFEYYSGTRPSGYELFSDGVGIHQNDFNEQLPSSDIYHLHWISQFLDYQSFFSNAAKFSPIVWTLHDMNAFTGGCHYDLGCEKYRTGCGECPQLGSSLQNDLSFHIWRNKETLFKKLHPKYLHIVSPSQWLAGKCKQSPFLKKFGLTVINNGIDVNDFSPRDRSFSRDILGLPHDAHILLFVAESVDNRRKGIDHLIDALSTVSETIDIHLLIIGNLKTNIRIDFPNTILASINNDRLLSTIYSAADLYVIPSIQDNLPNTVLESLSCGTPVIAFDVGGIREIIQEGTNGFLVPPKNIDTLRYTITQALRSKPNLAQMASNCRKSALENFSIVKQAKKYIELYNSLIANK